MIKPSLFAVGAIALSSGGAIAGNVYLNPEANVGIGAESGVGDGIGELHVGYAFDNGAYVQAGPAVVVPTGETEIEFSGKAGIGSGPLYGEVSFITGDELTFGLKAGAKFNL